MLSLGWECAGLLCSRSDFTGSDPELWPAKKAKRTGNELAVFALGLIAGANEELAQSGTDEECCSAKNLMFAPTEFLYCRQALGLPGRQIHQC
ncbi:hypothetical protein [Glutamicibacter mishrai]|uniref:hypothetical protein n=1 Tax=Glutamicibacter mishrai TaxID=1775880 RepID=UPI00155983DF|nr:hypothetical protein [Glutamicibacter mishrai]